MKFRTTILGALALAGAVPHLYASEGPHSFSVSGWLVSDYRFRGVSLTQKDPTVQLGFDYAHESGFYAGLWGSGVDFGPDYPDADLELDVYLGFGFPITDAVRADLSVVRYNYPDSGALNYNEFIGKLVFNEMITATLGYSNDIYNSDETGLYFGLSGSFPLPNEFALNANVGYSDFDDGVLGPGSANYMDYGIGVSRAFGPAELALTWIATNGDGKDLFGSNASSRLVGTLKVSF